jgi:hypothetical protein
MKTLTVAFVMFVSVAARADDQDKVGRYQLIYAAVDSFQVDINSKNTSKIEHKTVFKIDTVTGQVWKYSDISIGKASDEGFVPITTGKPQ